MSEPVGVGMIGLGMAGSGHLVAFAKSRRVRVVGAADPDPAACARAAKAVPGLTCTGDYRELLRRRDVRLTPGGGICLTWRSLVATGTVKWFNPTKGYGFIQPQAGGKDVFVHISAVERAGLSTLNEGQQVEYEIVANRGKESAENLKVR